MSKLKEVKILGIPLWLYLILLAATWYMGMMEVMPSNMIGALCFATFVGCFIGFIGDRIPIWNEWCGGGMLLACLTAGAFNTFHIIPDSLNQTLSTFNNDTGFLNLYILTLITGSVLSVNRKLLVRSFGGYIPCILMAIACSFALAAGVALVIGVNPKDAIMTYALPIMGGGNGAGALPMSKIWGEVTGNDPQTWYAPAFATLSLGNLFAVIIAALLNKLGLRKPEWTGNGQLMKLTAEEQASEEELKPTVADYASGLAVGLFCFVFSGYYASHLSIINNMKLGFSIHQFAFMIIMVALLNISGILPKNVRAGARGVQLFFVKYVTLPSMITIGIGTNLMDYVKVLNLRSIIIIAAVVIGGCIGAWIMAPLFKFYRIETTITAALCMANGGGSGDIQVLGASNRMELMSYAQLSSRIGGAIMLVIASFVFNAFLR